MDDLNNKLNEEKESEDLTPVIDNIGEEEENILPKDSIDFEDVAGDSESVDDDVNNDAEDTENSNVNESYNVEEPPIFANNPQQSIPVFSFGEPRPQKIKNKGLKVFSIILATILVIALSVSAGYFAGVYNTGNNGVNVNNSKLELEKRPDNDSEIYSTYSEAFSHVNESVVNIIVYSPTGSNNIGSASGVIYSKDGYIVTNDHIYEGIPKAKFMVRLWDGKEYKASFVAGDTRSDLAVIKIDKKVNNLKPANFGDSNEVLVGEQVITVGYPSSYGDSATLTHGIISAVDRRVTSKTTSYASSFLQTDAAINPGNSGGALANMYGQVVGITSSKLAGDTYDAVSYAIPTVTMKRVVSSLIKDKCVADRAKLGITYTEVNSLAAEANNLPVGVLISTIGSDSDLDGKGFDKGDVITHVNGMQITNSDILLKVIENSKAGDSIELTIYKAESKKSKTVNVKLLADKGTSSYTMKESSQSGGNSFDFGEFYDFDNNDDNSSNEEDNSSKAFDFPLN